MRWDCRWWFILRGSRTFPHANLRHYAFLNQGLPDIEADLAERNIGFVLRNAPHESHERLLGGCRCGDGASGMRTRCASRSAGASELAANLKIPFWTVDADVVVPSKLIEKAQYGAYTIRPRLYRLLPEFLVLMRTPKAEVAWKRPQGFHAGLGA